MDRRRDGSIVREAQNIHLSLKSNGTLKIGDKFVARLASTRESEACCAWLFGSGLGDVTAGSYSPEKDATSIVTWAPRH